MRSSATFHREEDLAPRTGVNLSGGRNLLRQSTGRNLPPAHGSLKVHPRKVFGLGLILSAMLGRYRQRSILALTLMVAQSFLYKPDRFRSR